MSPPSDGEPRPTRGYVDGCWDIMHSGHYNAIRQAKSLCDVLVVGVHSDAEIEENKAVPVMRQAERYALLEHIKWVDEIAHDVPYSPEIATLENCRADFCVHGDDMPVNAQGVCAYDEMRQSGRLRIVKRTEGVSTTDLIGRLLTLSRHQHTEDIWKELRAWALPFGLAAQLQPNPTVSTSDVGRDRDRARPRGTAMRGNNAPKRHFARNVRGIRNALTATTGKKTAVAAGLHSAQTAKHHSASVYATKLAAEEAADKARMAFTEKVAAELEDQLAADIARGLDLTGDELGEQGRPGRKQFDDPTADPSGAEVHPQRRELTEAKAKARQRPRLAPRDWRFQLPKAPSPTASKRPGMALHAKAEAQDQTSAAHQEAERSAHIQGSFGLRAAPANPHASHARGGSAVKLKGSVAHNRDCSAGVGFDRAILRTMQAADAHALNATGTIVAGAAWEVGQDAGGGRRELRGSSSWSIALTNDYLRSHRRARDRARDPTAQPERRQIEPRGRRARGGSSPEPPFIAGGPGGAISAPALNAGGSSGAAAASNPCVTRQTWLKAMSWDGRRDAALEGSAQPMNNAARMHLQRRSTADETAFGSFFGSPGDAPHAAAEAQGPEAQTCRSGAMACVDRCARVSTEDAIERCVATSQTPPNDAVATALSTLKQMAAAHDLPDEEVAVLRAQILACTPSSSSAQQAAVGSPGVEGIVRATAPVQLLASTRRITEFSTAGVPTKEDRVVYACGSFDMFHVGHAQFLKDARALGTFLLVGIYDDSTVRDAKGAFCPVMNLNERVLNVCACKWVDEVIIGAPRNVTEDLMKTWDIHVVARGKGHLRNGPDASKTTGHYAVPQQIGAYTEVPSAWPELCHDTVVRRIVESREQYLRRNRDRAQREDKYYAAKDKST
ncbi:unnamed protein product, partial [Prorocentrum cordatum]